jgi:hypothetical protein
MFRFALNFSRILLRFLVRGFRSRFRAADFDFGFRALSFHFSR